MSKQLYHGAHGSLLAVVTTIGFQKNPNRIETSKQHLDVWKKYCDFLDYAEKKVWRGQGKKRSASRIQTPTRQAFVLATAQAD
jgi:hypothetical protein